MEIGEKRGSKLVRSWDALEKVGEGGADQGGSDVVGRDVLNHSCHHILVERGSGRLIISVVRRVHCPYN